MKKPLIQLMKEAELEWPEGANYAAQDGKNNCVYFYYNKPEEPEELGAGVWFYHEDDCGPVESHQLKERCKEWDKTLITKEEYLGSD